MERLEREPVEEPAIHVGAMDAGFEARMANTFRTAYYLAKKERPFSDFAELVAMQERTGSTMPAFYRSDKAAARLVFRAIIHVPIIIIGRSLLATFNKFNILSRGDFARERDREG